MQGLEAGPYALAPHLERCFCKHQAPLIASFQCRATSVTSLPEGRPAAHLVSKLLLAHRLQRAHMINEAEPGCLPSGPYTARPELILIGCVQFLPSSGPNNLLQRIRMFQTICCILQWADVCLTATETPKRGKVQADYTLVHSMRVKRFNAVAPGSFDAGLSTAHSAS